ncbi:MAG: polyketide cyclase [Thermoleophilia bacterium]|nr:polyketide cyclase [Thermoleophilia bacterium]
MTTTKAREVNTGGKRAMTISENGDGSATLERFFDAPRELVFRILTTPELFHEWWGPRRYTTELVEMDMRVGGKWQAKNIDPDGTEYVFRGEYLEIDPPNALTQTFEFMGMPGAISTERLTLTEQDGGTLLRVVSDYGSVEAAQAVVSSGMENGASETYDRLEEILERELANA